MAKVARLQKEQMADEFNQLMWRSDAPWSTHHYLMSRHAGSSGCSVTLKLIISALLSAL